MTVDEWEMNILAEAVMFTAFMRRGPHERMRKEFDVEDGPDRFACRLAAYMAAAATVDVWAAGLGRPGLVYAINASGRQVLVTDALAVRAGFLP